MFWRLYEFSREHPQYFALMFVDRSVPRISREYERFAFAREMKQQIVEEIQACIDAGLLPPALDPGGAIRTLTMGLLGVAAMSLSERLAPGENADTWPPTCSTSRWPASAPGVTLRPTSACCPVLETSPTTQAS